MKRRSFLELLGIGSSAVAMGVSAATVTPPPVSAGYFVLLDEQGHPLNTETDTRKVQPRSRHYATFPVYGEISVSDLGYCRKTP